MYHLILPHGDQFSFHLPFSNALHFCIEQPHILQCLLLKERKKITILVCDLNNDHVQTGNHEVGFKRPGPEIGEGWCSALKDDYIFNKPAPVLTLLPRTNLILHSSILFLFWKSLLSRGEKREILEQLS